MSVTVFTPSPALGTDDNNPNSNFRTFVQLAGNSNGQIRIRFRASQGGSDLGITGASFGKWNGSAISATSGDMTGPPFQLTWSAATSVTIPATTTATSDFITHTGLTLSAGDWLIVAWFNAGSATAGERFSSGHSDATTMVWGAGGDQSQQGTIAGTGGSGSWTVIGGIQPGSANGVDYIVDLVETNDPTIIGPFTNGAKRIFM